MCVGLELACRRPGAETFRRRRRPVRRGPAPGHRHRRAERHGCPCSRERDRGLRGPASARRAVPDDSHRGRVFGHARPPGVDRRACGDGDRGGGGRRHRRPERRSRGARAVRPSRHSPDRRSTRLRRSALAPPCAGSRRDASVEPAAGAGGSAGGAARRCQSRRTGGQAGAARAPGSRCATRACAFAHPRHDLGLPRPRAGQSSCPAWSTRRASSGQGSDDEALGSTCGETRVARRGRRLLLACSADACSAGARAGPSGDHGRRL
jgi:hypothetical protein